MSSIKKELFKVHTVILDLKRRNRYNKSNNMFFKIRLPEMKHGDAPNSNCV